MNTFWQDKIRPGRDRAFGLGSQPALNGVVNDTAKPRPKVAVLGGGISGLSTAYQLAKQGVDVTIIEASPRVGGIIQTVRNATSDGSYFERAAELVDTNHTALITMMKELGVGLVSSDTSTDPKAGDMFYANGVMRSEDQFLEAYKPLAAQIKSLQLQLRDPQGNWTQTAQQLDRISMDEFLTQCAKYNNTPPWVNTLLKQAYAGELGRDADQLSALAFVDMVGADVDRGLELFGDSDEAFRVENGTDSIITALQSKLGQMGVTIQTGTRVKQIGQTANGMQLQLEQQGALKEAAFDHVISALPLPALRKVGGLDTLGLSPDQLGAIQNTQYAHINKIGVETKGKPWLKATSSDGSPTNGGFFNDGIMQSCWVSNAAQPTSSPDGNGLVTFYIGGRTSTLSPNELIDKAKSEYATMLGMRREDVFTDTAPVFTYLGDENRSCFVSPGVNQYLPLQSLKQQTHPHFSLVGEFIPYGTERGHNTGCMNNGIDSGQREAMRAVALLQQKGYQVGESSAPIELSPAAATTMQTASAESLVPAYPSIAADQQSRIIGPQTQALQLNVQLPYTGPPRT